MFEPQQAGWEMHDMLERERVRQLVKAFEELREKQVSMDTIRVLAYECQATWESPEYQ